MKSHGLSAVFVLLAPLSPAAGGVQWVSSGPGGGLITALAVDPSEPSTLYAGVRDAGMYKSDNGGASWRPRRFGRPTRIAIIRKAGRISASPRPAAMSITWGRTGICGTKARCRIG
jgi:hypothetical protein